MPVYPDDADVFVIISKDDVDFAKSTLWAFNTLWMARGWHIVAYIPPDNDFEGVYLPVGALYRGIYAPLGTYVLNNIVTYGGTAYICLGGPITNLQPDLHPEAWEVFAIGGAAANTILSEGDVGNGVTGAASTSSGTPTYADISGCAVAPNVITPITLRIRGILSVTTSTGALTSYRNWIRVVDDLDAPIGMAVERRTLSSATPQLINFAADIKVTPADAARTYRLQGAMTDATGGTPSYGGTSFGLAGNKFRLEATPR